MPSSATLILCTKDGGRQLKNCLEHIEAIEAPDGFEVILVDNGSDKPDSIAALRSFAGSTRHRCMLVREMAPGNGAGRNTGIRAATNDLLIFIDDDCYPEPSFVADWIAVFESRSLGYATGRVLPVNPDNAIHGFCRIGLQEELVAPHGFVRPGLMQGSNMAFTRQCLDAIGGFDPLFGSGVRYAGEDWDVALRASEAGFAGGYVPRPAVGHDHGRSIEEGARRNAFYVFGFGAVYAKHARSRLGTSMLRRFLRQSIGPKTVSRWRLMAGFLDYLIKHRWGLAGAIRAGDPAT
ncbi:MAG: glycosyltransferase family 2 protein [Polymorphobacter sp.]|uniref:glycosyltransferase family 2 protein n=1 Tax=Polymorphobacter sp. TaxID=1909290 RepID=UPI003A8A0138